MLDRLPKLSCKTKTQSKHPKLKLPTQLDAGEEGQAAAELPGGTGQGSTPHLRNFPSSVFP